MIAVVAMSLVSAVALHRASRASSAWRAHRRVVPAGIPRSLDPRLRRLLDRALRNRRDRQVERALPDALDAVARSLRSGSSLRQALDEAAGSMTGPLGEDLERLTGEIADGATLVDALARWPALRPVPGVRLAAAALSLGAETGGASAQAVDGVAATLRTNLGIAGEVRALSSQARLSALVIVLAPIAFAVLAAATDGSTATFLLGTRFGLLCVAAGLGLDGLGWWWMRRILAVVA